MTSVDQGFQNLDRAGRATARIGSASRAIVYSVLGVAIAFSWFLLIAYASRSVRAPGDLTPGATLLKMLPDLPLPLELERLLDVCLSPVEASAGAPETFFALTAMWVLMSIAMMLPSAAPMIRTYCELADTAGRQKQPVAHPLVFLSGYLSVWFAASIAFAALTMLVQAMQGELSRSANLLAASAAIGFAGLYQFSSLKETCLKKCRNPFSILFSRWTTRPSGIFRLGAEQGVWCMGCCWALMLVMFAVGLMNVFWMALLGILTLVEKQVDSPVTSRIAGAILLVWSAALLLLSI